MALWGISEMTCAMLIFCVPSIPKIFRDSRLSLKFPKALSSYLKLHSKRPKSGSGSTWPRFGSKKLPLDSMCEPNFDNGPSTRQYGPAEAKKWPLEGAPSQMLDHLEYPQTGILRTTEIVAAEEGNSYRNTEVPRHQSPWDSYSA